MAERSPSTPKVITGPIPANYAELPEAERLAIASDLAHRVRILPGRSVTLNDKDGPLGTVTLENGVLTGSNPVLQNLADSHLRSDGSAEAAYDALKTLNNGYVWAS